MQPHRHGCYYCQFLVEMACECAEPARVVICDNCQMIYEMPEEDSSETPS